MNRKEILMGIFYALAGPCHLLFTLKMSYAGPMPLQELYRKVEAFQNNLSAPARSLSQCRKGCSRCCMVDLSVFRIEADSVRKWFRELAVGKADELRSLWSGEKPEGGCAFLVNDACTIYEARPLICRTQGLPLRFIEGGQTFLDICPLNEEMLNITLSSEVMNLDLLNLILAQLERHEGEDRPREKLSDLRAEFLRK